MKLTKKEKAVIKSAQESVAWKRAHAHLTPEERGMAMVAQGMCTQEQMREISELHFVIQNSPPETA